MNRVVEINEDLAYAVVEPGVTWFDLHDALRAGGHQLMVSIPDLGWSSVIGNSMDNGITYLPNGADHMAPTGLEVVLPDGDLLRPAWVQPSPRDASFRFCICPWQHPVRSCHEGACSNGCIMNAWRISALR